MLKNDADVVSREEAQFMVDRVTQAYSALLGQAITELAAMQMNAAKLQAENDEIKSQLLAYTQPNKEES